MMNKTTFRKTIVEYLEHTPSKSCTFVALLLLCDYFEVSHRTLMGALQDLFYDRVIDIVPDEEYLARTTIRLIPNLNLID